MKKKKIVFTLVAIFVVSMTSLCALAKEDNGSSLLALEKASNAYDAYDACGTKADEGESGKEWHAIFNECLEEQNSNVTEAATWDFPSNHEDADIDIDEADMVNDSAIDE